MPTPAPAFGRASLGLVALDSPTWALRRGLASLEGDLPAAIVRIDANGTSAEVRRGRARWRPRPVRPSPGSPRQRPVALAEELALACPDVVLDSALCGDELVGGPGRHLQRVRPRRSAHRSLAGGSAPGSEGEGALDGLDGVDVMGRGADARRLADWLSAGVKVPVWIVGHELGIEGVRLRFGRHERVVPPPALAASATLGDALDLVACGHELVRALQGSAARLRRAGLRAQRSNVTGLLSVPTPLTVMSTTSPSRR